MTKTNHKYRYVVLTLMVEIPRKPVQFSLVRNWKFLFSFFVITIRNSDEVVMTVTMASEYKIHNNIQMYRAFEYTFEFQI
jgi:hypothetical protein